MDYRAMVAIINHILIKFKAVLCPTAPDTQSGRSTGA
jgi:hypothetical protein